MSYIALIGKKAGMTSYFTEEETFAVTLIQVKPNFLINLKTKSKDGYNALVIATSTIGSKTNKAQQGELKKVHDKIAGDAKKIKIKEFRINDELKSIDKISPHILSVGNLVDVISVSKGKGFQGVMKMYGFGGQPQSHGTSLTHRSLGSTGCRQDPGRVFKNKKMPGRMGNNKITTQNLKVIDVDEELGLLVIKGTIPGNNGDIVYIRDAIKSRREYGGSVNGQALDKQTNVVQ